MSTSFKPAVRENFGIVLGLAGGTGSGKTKSAFELAAGICGDKPFAVCDSESRRARMYADEYKFDHAELRSPFRPQSFTEKILEADKLGYPAIVVDSFSHEYAGEGGLLDWHDENVAATVLRMKAAADRGGYPFDELKAEGKANFDAWIEPKMAHKEMVQKILQVKAHLILCFRAEGNKTVVRPIESATGVQGWVPVTEKNLPYELLASFLLVSDRPGVPIPIKLNAQHRGMFATDKPITRDSGRQLAAWAGTTKKVEPSANLRAGLALIASAVSIEELAKSGPAMAELSAEEKSVAKEAYRVKHAQLKASEV